MKPIFVPTSDLSVETAILVSWKHEEGTRVEAGMVLAEIETDKMIIEVHAAEAGIVGHAVKEGAEFRLKDPIGTLFDSVDELHRHPALEEKPSPAQDLDDDDATIASAPATFADFSTLPRPLSVGPGHERVLLVGGGRAATQVIDILRDSDRQRAVAILDDDGALWGKSVYGVPICGPASRLRALYNDKTFDAAIVAINTSTAARAKFRSLLLDLGIPLTNAIDRTSKLSGDVKIGKGNIISPFSYFGTGTIIGDNNFFSAYNSFDHHSEIGNDSSTGPGCISSGSTKLRDRVRLGAGIIFEPGVELGEGVEVASGAILVKSVPAHHAVKTKIVATSVVPIRK